MIDPCRRGRRARRALPLVRPEIRSLVLDAVQRHAQDNCRMIANVKELLMAEPVQDWCRALAAGSEDKIGKPDATAAVASLYLKAALANQSLNDNYTQQMGAVLVPVLKRAIRFTKLGEWVPQDAPPPAKGIHPFLWERIYTPMASHVLLSLSEMRLLKTGPVNTGPGRPFAWSPLYDSLGAVCEFALLGKLPAQPPRRFIYSPFARFLIHKGYAAIVPVQTYVCQQCGRGAAGPPPGRCRVCGGLLECVIRPHCLSVAHIHGCRRTRREEGRVFFVTENSPASADRPILEEV